MRRLARLAALVLLAGGIVLLSVTPRRLRAVIVVPAATGFAIAARRELRANGARHAPAAAGGTFVEGGPEDIGR